MRTTRISKGGQVTVPPEVRKRWGGARLLVEDHGDALVFRPIPDDPIAAFAGKYAGPGPTADQVKQQERDADHARERRRIRARLRALGT